MNRLDLKEMGTVLFFNKRLSSIRLYVRQKNRTVPNLNLFLKGSGFPFLVQVLPPIGQVNFLAVDKKMRYFRP